ARREGPRDPEAAACSCDRPAGLSSKTSTPREPASLSRWTSAGRGTGSRPVREVPMPTIFCVGRNYAAHGKEMGGSAERDAEMVVFTKPWQALLAAPGPIRLPSDATE